MTVDELASQLYAVAEARAHMVGRNFGGGADNDLRAMTNRAAAEILSFPDDGSRLLEIEAAKFNIQRLIDLAIANAQAITGYPADLLGEESYFPAKMMRFCPCRPFC